MRYSYRRRRAARAALRWLIAFPVRHPRVIAGPLAAGAVLGAGAAMRPVAPMWQLAALGGLLAVVAAVQIIRAPMPLWRRVAWWAAVAAGLASLLGGWTWAAVLLGAAVAVGVVELPRWPRVTIEGEYRELPGWARPGRLVAPVRRVVRRSVRSAARGRADGADVARRQISLPPGIGARTASQTVRETVPETVVQTPERAPRTAPETVERPAEPITGPAPLVGEEAIARHLLADGQTAAPVELYRALGVSRATLHRRAVEWIADGWLVRADGGYRLADPAPQDGAASTGDGPVSRSG